MDMHGNSIVIRSKTFKSWMRHHFTNQQLKEMCIYGVKSGYYGLIDHRDLSKLYRRFGDEIQEYVSGTGWSLSSFVEHVQPDDMEDIEEAMTWYAAEVIATEITGNEE